MCVLTDPLRTDPEGCFRDLGHRAWVSANGMEWLPEPGEAHWRMGSTERMIGVIKDIATKMAMELPEETKPKEIFDWAVIANNDLMRHEGYSPLMLLTGRTSSGHGLFVHSYGGHLFDDRHIFLSLF